MNYSCGQKELKWLRVNWSSFVNNIMPYTVKFKCSPLKIHYNIEVDNVNHEIVKHGMIIKTMVNIEKLLLKVIHIDHIEIKNDTYTAYAYFYTISNEIGTWVLEGPCRKCFNTYNILEPQEDLKYLFLEHKFQYDIPFISGV